MATAPTVESIQQAALQLRPGARALLTHTLVQSLDGLSEAELSELWLAETERRDAEMESGQIVGIPGEEVFRRLHLRYGK